MLDLRNPHHLTNALRLYLVTDQGSMHGRALLDVVAQAVQGGVTCVQLREKTLPEADFVLLAKALRQALEPWDIPLVINDNVAVALACGAQGIHLGQSDASVTTARAALPSHMFIGWSVEAPAHVQQSASLPVDYLGVSPVFPTPTKTDTATPWGLDGLYAVRGSTQLPLVAIGGIQLHNARAVMKAGADGIAVVSAICSADDPRGAAHELRALVDDYMAPSDFAPLD